MKWMVSLLVLALALAAAAPVRAADLMLNEPPRTDYRWYGVLFLGLSALSFSIAQHDYDKSDTAKKKADDTFDLYKAATTSTDADRYHSKTNRYHRQAVAFESTANAAVLVGVVLGLTGIYSFTDNSRDTPILLSLNRVTVRVRF